MILLPLHWPGLRGQFTPVAVTSFAPPKHILPTSPFFSRLALHILLLPCVVL